MLIDTPHDARSSSAGASTSAKGSRFELASGRPCCEAEAIDLTSEGLGLAVVLAHRGADARVGRGRHRPLDRPRRLGRPASRPSSATWAACAAGGGTCRASGWRLPPDAGRRLNGRWRPRVPGGAAGVRGRAVPVVLPRAAALPDRGVGARGMTLRAAQPDAPLVRGHGARLRAAPARRRRRARARAPDRVRRGGRRLDIGVEWVEPSRDATEAISHYLLAGDATLTPARLRAGGLAVGRVERAVTYDCAASPPTTRRSSRCACSPTRRRDT